MHINEGKDKLALFSTKYNVLLTPLPFHFYLSPQSLLHNFIIFPPPPPPHFCDHDHDRHKIKVICFIIIRQDSLPWVFPVELICIQLWACELA